MTSIPGRYTKRPVTIEAVQWDGTNDTSDAIQQWVERPAVQNTYGASVVDTHHIRHLWDYDIGAYIMPNGKVVFAPFNERCLIVFTLEGEMVAKPGWWIIKGVKGEFYPCEPAIFTETYTLED